MQNTKGKEILQTKNEFGNKEQYLDSSFGFLWKNTIPYSYEEINSEGKVHVSSQTDNPKRVKITQP